MENLESEQLEWKEMKKEKNILLKISTKIYFTSYKFIIYLIIYFYNFKIINYLLMMSPV